MQPSPAPSQPATLKGRFVRFLASDTGLLALLALAKLLIHLLTSGGYGYFRDELYYMAAGRRLDFGYVDYPPFVALVAALARVVGGETLLALRFLPALAGASVVFITGLIARALGGGRAAQGMAALCILITPQYLGMNSLLTMDSFDTLFWVLCLYLLVRILLGGSPHLWLWFGLVAGLGLTAKVTILYLGAAIVVGLFIGGQRSQFKQKELYLGGLIALAFLVPYILWNAAHDWPTLLFWQNYGNKLPSTPPWSFLFQQIMIMNPGLFPIWLAGLYFTFTPSGKPYRPIGIAYLFLLIILMIQQAKNYFLAPFYPVLFALGVVMILHHRQWPSRWRFFGTEYVRTTALITLVFLPLTLPILPLDWEVRYMSVFGFLTPRTEVHETGVLPQYLADRLGWVELADTVASVYQQLSPEDQSKACIFADNYGQAGALEFFGRSRGLPTVVSGHNSYYLWGPGDCTGEVLIVVGSDREDLQPLFEQVEEAAITSCQYCVPYENNEPVFIARKLRLPLEQAWPGVINFQ